MVAEKKVLEDVVVIRLVLIVLLVLCHAFAIFNGAWEKPLGVPDMPTYWWVTSFSSAFVLEAFVFISGYILGYQVCRNGSQMLSFNGLIRKKAKRLLLPGIFFSSIYYVLFYDLDKPAGEILYAVLNGCGHLWFLPMLFWCFVAIYVINKLQLKPALVFPLALVCSLCSFIPLPLRLTSALYYFSFFYLGFWCRINHTRIGKYFDIKYVIISVCLFIGLFVPLRYISEYMNMDNYSAVAGWCNSLTISNLIYKSIKLFIHNAFRVTYSVSGVIMLFITINLFLKKGLHISPWLKKVSTLCFGVYIYQQFVLKYLYYHTELVSLCSPVALPWIGFFTALAVSLLFSRLTLETRFGRFLIG